MIDVLSLSTRPRSPLLLATIAIVALGLAAAPATPAAAQATGLSCPGYQTISWDPGLLVTPRTVTTTGSTLLGPCIDPADEISSGESSFGGEETMSCLAISQTSGAEHITWDTGETTSFSWTASEIAATNMAGVVVATIQTDIESGKFAGMQVTYVITSASLNPLHCLSDPGLTSASGPIELTISP